MVALMIGFGSGAQAQQMGAGAAGIGAGLSYASVMGTGGVVYKFSPETFLGLHYSYWNVDNHFNGNTFAFDRHLVQITLTQAFY